MLPLLILAGAVDGWIGPAPGVVERFVGDGGRVIAAAAPPEAMAQWGLRFLVVFAFMQTMHYVVWVAFLPRFAPEAIAAFDARVPWLRGRRAWLFGLAAGAAESPSCSGRTTSRVGPCTRRWPAITRTWSSRSCSRSSSHHSG